MIMLNAAAAPDGDLSQATMRPVLLGSRITLKRGDERFPPALEALAKPPERLNLIGDAAALQEGIAIIGARKATPYGLACARRFAQMAARQGISVISGGAYGCDAEAHRAALDAGGTTVAFFGCGCDHIYPARHFRLFQDIVDSGGAVVSERDWAEKPRPWMFRERNRLIAGLAKATLVVEAGLPSGTFTTADEAMAACREVLVVPGAITSPTSAGANHLLAQGAIPIINDESFQTALTFLFGTLPGIGTAKTEQGRADPLLDALRANPMRVEELLALGLAGEGDRLQQVTRLTAMLSELERQGSIARFPDGRYGPARL